MKKMLRFSLVLLLCAGFLCGSCASSLASSYSIISSPSSVAPGEWFVITVDYTYTGNPLSLHQTIIDMSWTHLLHDIRTSDLMVDCLATLAYIRANAAIAPPFTFSITFEGYAPNVTQNTDIVFTLTPNPAVDTSPPMSFVLRVIVPPTPNQPSGTSSGTASEQEPILQPQHQKAKIIGVRKYANIRDNPSIEAAIIGAVSVGETIELLQWSADEKWCRIAYNNGDNVGWLYGKLIQPII